MLLRSTLLLSSLITLAACSDDGGGSTSDASTGNTTPATSEPSTGEAPTGTTSEPMTSPTSTTSTTEPATSTTDPATTTGDTDGTTGEDTTTGMAGPSWAVDVYPVLNPPVMCDCHTPGSGNLKLGDPETAYMNLVGVPAAKGTLLRVEPGDASKSFLWHKINGTQADVGGGSKMPLGAPDLPQETIDLIAAWIDAGAQP
ncbi:MAG TPA: hypothetical protein VGB85_24295 [Nannocystis sp.]